MVSMSYLDQIVNDDFVWNKLVNALPGRRKTSNNNFINICCPMCTRRGETQDKKFRCGIKHDSKGIGIHCFNCGIKTRWMVGTPMGKSFKEFLESVGLTTMEIKKLSFHAVEVSRILSQSDILPPSLYFTPSFNTTTLPPEAQTLATWAHNNCVDTDFINAVEYLYSRGNDIATAIDYYWTPNKTDNLNKRIIIPFYFQNNLVGWTARSSVDDLEPRYWTNVPPHFLFNNRVMTLDRKYVIIVEGIFDAIAIDGIATMGAKLSNEQAKWINSCGKTPILLADRDRTGGKLIEIALHHNWMVSFPRLAAGEGRRKDNWWDADVKDAAEATQRYGKLYTLQSIISSATGQKMEIAMKRKMVI